MSVDERADGAAYATPDEADDIWVQGADWEEIEDAVSEGRLTVNLGPQHPSTHGVLRLVLELEGETVHRVQPVIGYLHTGIEKNTEYRTWIQGTTFVTRMDYLSPLFNETAYSLAVEKLLGIEAPERAQAVRVILMEFNRIASHLVWLATTGMELGAISVMIYGFRERESILDLFEAQSGLRMNHGYIRPGGLGADVTDDFEEMCRAILGFLPEHIAEYEDMLEQNPIFMERTRGVGVLDVEACKRYGVTGPLLRSAGMARDTRTSDPYCGYEQYDFEVPTRTEADSYARFLVRMGEIRQSMRIIDQALDRLPGGPVMVADKKIAWPAQLGIGGDGIGNDPTYIRHIMGESMEALIHHFKLVTEGFAVPPGQVYVPVESARGELGYHVVSNGTTKPYRVHVRDPSFVNLQSVEHMSRGHLVADLIAIIASLDPVIGGADR
ncbi:MAG TPA: NADH-quinone oxidoreductase subunit D [Nitriliruptorales bacterium]|nr:NADH-quinone oxidoreductase subunit D [Nitriliruptorales bacterium]